MGNYYTTNTNYIITTDFYMISYSAIYVIVRRKFCSFLLQKTGKIEQLVDSPSNVDWFICVDWKLVDCSPRCQWSVNQGVNRLSLEYQLIIYSVDQGLMESIDRHATSYASSTYDPKHLYATLLRSDIQLPSC